jgi:hypothetical protein
LEPFVKVNKKTPANADSRMKQRTKFRYGVKEEGRHQRIYEFASAPSGLLVLLLSLLLLLLLSLLLLLLPLSRNDETPAALLLYQRRCLEPSNDD